MPYTTAIESSIWLTAQQLHPAPNEVELQWLLNDESLTRRLTALAAGAFSVIPLNQRWEILRDDECEALAIPLASEGWVREVYLCGAQQPWVFARSVAARSALQRSNLPIQQLGERSLGELLFSDTAYQRGELQVCRYPQQWLPLANQQTGLWGRRSCFSRATLTLLVAEVFLADFWHHAQPSAKQP